MATDEPRAAYGSTEQSISFESNYVFKKLQM